MIYNNFNNGYNNTNTKQKIQRNDRNNRIFLRKKNSHSKYENQFQNYTLGI